MVHDNRDIVLKAMIATYGHTRSLKTEGVSFDGGRLDFVEVTPIVAAYRRMIRELEFDICELPPITYLCAREAGVPITAIPAFINRNFHHGDIACRPGSGIREPKDLEGRKVGVRAYSVSTGLWVRGILSDEFGVDLSRITWVVDDEEHVAVMRLPGNVERVLEGVSLSGMFRDGTIDAAVKGAAGIGRTGAAAKNWEQGGVQNNEYYDLIANPEEQDILSYQNTHIYPIHGLVAIRNDIVNQYPWLPKALYRKFESAKNRFINDPGDASKADAKDAFYLRFRGIMGGDPLPYGIEANRETLDAMIRFAWEQGIIHAKPAVEEIFEDVED
jgi:4,5-dihydroxyphthalate decarboxylase